jgi:hypothetical protein
MKRTLPTILAMLAVPLAVYSWTRSPLSDQTVVERAELIVVGRILPASIKRIDHPAKPGEGASHEHHATLEIVETLKGSAKTTTIEVIIHYGLDPVTERCINTKDHFFDDRASKPTAAKGAIEIYDTGGMDRRISGDIREPQIWLLSTKNPGYTTPDSTAHPGIWDPEDIQPLTKKEALKKWIAP